ncbi:MAG: tRNA (adenosine(37)-N6)-threonylcarbamoyltransferase complex dimerization subunit type 1 TsaB [Candidatus Cloacimonadota bacterium]|nr:tRNA (adenosine(37)-N6)-threonylcarbamoyltransferase complex dimerization subunit type 1 TsaB [Candidatus Cloacimonadota bacterium]
MNLLAFDTSTTYGTIAFASEGKIIAENVFSNQKTHSTKLLPAIKELLNDCDVSISKIDAIAVGIGPGSFTGLRIALSTAKGICYGQKIPLIPISTLTSLANNIANPAYQICSVLNAGREQFFTALFSSSLDEIEKPQIVEKKNLFKDFQKKTILVGPPLDDLNYRLKSNRKNILFTPFHLNFPRASSMINYIITKKIEINYNYKQIADIQPLYLRRAAAEENFKN